VARDVPESKEANTRGQMPETFTVMAAAYDQVKVYEIRRKNPGVKQASIKTRFFGSSASPDTALGLFSTMTG
jgi:hypothetical protein